MYNEQFLARYGGEKEKRQATIHKNSLSGSLQQRPRILIVEDERLIAEDLREILQNAGHTVVGIFSTGEEVLQKLIETNPDLILMDIRLKGPLDGIQTALTIHNTVKMIPVLFLTAHTKDHYPDLSLLKSSSFMYLTKPFQIETLLKNIKKLLSSK